MGKQCIEDGSIVVVDGKPEIHACRFWVTMHGTNPQTGELVNNSDCAHAWTPVLLIENSKMQRETGAAVESFRNEMVNAQASSQQLFIELANRDKISKVNTNSTFIIEQ